MSSPTRGTRVFHQTLGQGTVKECYEFYNVQFLDVLFDKHEETAYIKSDNVKII